MTEMWRSLVDVLDEMQALYQRLRELGEAKRDLLVRAKPEALDEVNRQEEALVIQGSELENRRAQATAVILTAHGLSGRQTNLSELIPLADGDTAERLDAFIREFGTLLKDLSRINATNAKLTEQALAFVNFNLNLLTRRPAENTYAPVGRGPVPGTMSALLDRKV